MTQAWRTLATVATAEGALELRQRGARDFLIVIDGRVLMTTSGRRSEQALATLGCGELATRAGARVLIGGLGMAYTLRACLEVLPATAAVEVAELSPEVVAWCEGPLAPLTDGAVRDPRVTVTIADVAAVIAAARARFDAILLDLYEGPNPARATEGEPFYGAAALGRARAALVAGGTLAVWSEDADPAFARRFVAAGFAVTTHRPGRGGRSHVVYLGRSTTA